MVYNRTLLIEKEREQEGRQRVLWSGLERIKDAIAALFSAARNALLKRPILISLIGPHYILSSVILYPYCVHKGASGMNHEVLTMVEWGVRGCGEGARGKGERVSRCRVVRNHIKASPAHTPKPMECMIGEVR